MRLDVFPSLAPIAQWQRLHSGRPSSIALPCLPCLNPKQFQIWLLEFVFLISGATDEHVPADSLLGPVLLPWRVCVCCLVFVTAVRASGRDRTLVLKRISIEAELSTWSSFLPTETHEQAISSQTGGPSLSYPRTSPVTGKQPINQQLCSSVAVVAMWVCYSVASCTIIIVFVR